MSKITQVFEDMASGRPIKKPVKSNLLKARKDANEKALKSGFMKMPDYVKKTFEEKEEEYKPHYMYKGDKKVHAKKKEDHDKLNKQGYDHDDPKTKKIEEEKGRGPTGISYTVTPGHPDAENPKTGKKYPERQTSAYKSKWKEKSKPGLGQHVGSKNPMNEAKKNCGCGQDPCITYGKGGKKDMKESFRHYNVTHKPSGKKYKVTAMHDKSAAEKARAQHGGSASRYSGTSTNDFHVEETQFTPESVMEAKKKGLDGKACWDGYKQMGTKMKGGKRVDNCVKMKEEIIAEISDEMKMRYIRKANKQITSAEKERLAGKGHAVKTDSDYNRIVSKPLKRRKGVVQAKSKLGESTRDKYNPKVSELRNKEKMNKVGLPAGKGPLVKDENISEISDHMKKRYISQANKSISKDEHMKDYLQRQMNRSNAKTPGTFSGMNKKFVDDKYDKDINKRRKGVAKAKASLQKESSSWVQQTADTWNDHADHKHPKVQKHIKKAETAYNNKDMEAFHHHTTRAADHAHSLKKNESYDRMSWPTHNRHRQRTSARVTADTLNSPTILKKRQEMHPAARKAYDNKVRDNNNKKYGYHPTIGHKQNRTDALPKHMHHPKVGLNDSIQRDVYMSLKEISKGLAGRYIKRAVGDAITQADKTQYHTSKMFQKHDAGDRKGGNKEYDKAAEPKRKTMNRFYGIQRAASKMDKKDKNSGEYLAHSMTKQKTSGKVKATEEKMIGSEYSTYMKGVKSTNRDVRSAVSHTLDQQKSPLTKKHSKHPEVKKAQKYMASESLNQLIGQAVKKIKAASDEVKKKVEIKNASIKNPSTY